jgi:hypothetical protein
LKSFPTDESRPDEQPASRNNVLAHHAGQARDLALDAASAVARSPLKRGMTHDTPDVHRVILSAAKNLLE